MTDTGLFDRTPAVLVLADGEVFCGEAAVAGPPAYGEVVFNTALSGYQEIVSDPSYAGQLVAMTYPHIGNYGTNPDDDEAATPACAGMIVRAFCAEPSNYRSTEGFGDYLTRHGRPCISGIDTRRLTRHLRDAGAVNGGIFSGSDALAPVDELVARVVAQPSMEGRDLASVVTTPATYASPYRPDVARFRVALVDFGVKRTILRRLAAVGCDVTVFGSGVSADELLAHGADGVMLSNGPGDPAAVPGAADMVRGLFGNVAVFGICLGHQILGLATGLETTKLPFGHHGGNHPVLDVRTNTVEITSQNHGFAVALPGDRGRADTAVGTVELTHRNLNDGTCEGLRCLDIAAFSVQHHPEAGPGPHDATHLFDDFVELMRTGSTATIAEENR